MGGCRLARALEFDPSDSIAVRLQQRGYVTALFGKYLNGYADLFPEIPPGWDDWRVFRDGVFDLFGPGSLYRDPMFSWNGQARREQGYSTDLLADYAVEFIEANAANPFFLLLSFWAPHVPLVPAERHAGLLEGRVPDRPPSLDERDLSERPEWLPHNGPVDASEAWEAAWPRYQEHRSHARSAGGNPSGGGRPEPPAPAAGPR